MSWIDSAPELEPDEFSESLELQQIGYKHQLLDKAVAQPDRPFSLFPSLFAALLLSLSVLLVSFPSLSSLLKLKVYRKKRNIACTISHRDEETASKGASSTLTRSE